MSINVLIAQALEDSDPSETSMPGFHASQRHAVLAGGTAWPWTLEARWYAASSN
jgi:hypothetical protein